MDRFKKYLEILDSFLEKSSSIHDIMLEMQTCQKIQAEILSDKYTIKTDYQKAKMDYEHFLACKMDSVSARSKKHGISIRNVQELQNRTIKQFQKEIEEKRFKMHRLECELDTIQNIYFIVLQRKDILVSVLKYWSNKSERESCLMQNKHFIEKVIDRIDV